MYLGCTVKIHDTACNTTVKMINGVPYDYYEYARVYDSLKSYEREGGVRIQKLMQTVQ